jgi:hypothetical protein
MPTFSILRPYIIYTSWGFGFENIPSGNPGSNENKRRRTTSRKSERVARFALAFMQHRCDFFFLVFAIGMNRDPERGGGQFWVKKSPEVFLPK